MQPEVDNLRCHFAALRIDKSRIAAAFCTQQFNVYVSDTQLWRKGKTLPLVQQLPILIDNGIAAIDHILRTLPETTAAIDISTHGTGTLLSQQGLQIVMFANQFITCREIKDQVCASQCQMVAWRNGGPHIFTDFHSKLHTAFQFEQKRPLGQCNGISRIAKRLPVVNVLGGGKPAFLIKLSVIGQVYLGDKCGKHPSTNNSGAVQENLSRINRDSHDDRNLLVRCESLQVGHSLLSFFEQQTLCKEILTGISGQAKLWENDYLHAFLLSFLNLPPYLLNVIFNISNLHRRDGSCDSDHSVIHLALPFFIILSTQKHSLIEWLPVLHRSHIPETRHPDRDIACIYSSVRVSDSAEAHLHPCRG